MIFFIKGFKNLMVNEENLKVVSVDKGNGTFLCTDGAEYPLGDTTVTVEELQEGLVNAKKIMGLILNGDGETAQP